MEGTNQMAEIAVAEPEISTEEETMTAEEFYRFFEDSDVLATDESSWRFVWEDDDNKEISELSPDEKSLLAFLRFRR
jgi:CRISPR/Cas system CMR-associated protein Cmr3 (group 5 of RAMP superfamily)